MHVLRYTREGREAAYVTAFVLGPDAAAPAWLEGQVYPGDLRARLCLDDDGFEVMGRRWLEERGTVQVVRAPCPPG